MDSQCKFANCKYNHFISFYLIYCPKSALYLRAAAGCKTLAAANYAIWRKCNTFVDARADGLGLVNANSIFINESLNIMFS